MTTVDNRIVHMTFDNAQFEKNMAQTIASMDHLKKSLDFSAAKNNFSELSRASSGFSLGGMASAIDNISSKFTALGAVAFSVISGITGRVLDAGINMAKAFTISPIVAGFQEMETNMNSIQTILANTSSKGSTLEDVNGALGQLNEYSDQTIYNFGQMAKNIGTFTAAGVDLDTSVGSIKGIANIAAISGSNAEQASNAMYQLSQALASGSVKLMDWNSIVNAGMGGEVFQKALFETGKSLGTLQDVGLDTTFDDWKKAGNTFRTSLEDGWLTADVLTNTLNAFTGDLDTAQLTALGYTEEQAAEMLKLGQLGKAAATEVKTLTQLMGTVKESVGSGWSKTFQIVFGDFEEAKSLFTGLSTAIGDFVGKQADKRNDLLQGWKDLGGRNLLLQSLENGFKALGKIMNVVSEAFKEVFPPATAKTLYQLTLQFSIFIQSLKPSITTLGKIKTIFKGVFSAVSIVVEIVKQVASVFKQLFSTLVDATGGGVFDFLVNLAEKVIDLKKVLVDEGGIKGFFDNLIGFFKDPMPVIEGFIRDIKGAFNQIKTLFLTGDFVGGGPFEEDSPIIAGFYKFKDLLAGGFNSIGDFIKKFADGISDILNVNIKVPEGLTDFFKSFGERVDENTTNSLAGGFDRLSDALSAFWEVLKKVWDVLGKIMDGVQKAWDVFKAFVDFLGNAFTAIFDFAKNIGPNLQKAFKSEEFDKILEFMSSLGVLLGGAGIANVSKNGLKIDFSGGALTQLSEVFKTLGGKKGLISEIKKSFEELTDTLGAMQLKLKADALMKIAIAIGVLTASLLVLSMIDPEALAKALGAMAGGFAELIGSMALLDKIGGAGGAGKIAILAGGLILLASAALVLSGAVVNLARLDWEDLGRGLTGITVLLGLLVSIASALEGKGASMLAAGAGMIAIAIAMNILVGAVKLFSMMNWEDLGKGFTAVGVGLGLIAGAMNLMPASTILIGPGLMAVAIALNILAGAIALFATMDWGELGKGFVAIGVGLGLIAAGMNLMPASTVLTGPGLMAVATALTILGGALKIFASMSWKEIGKAMTVLGGSLLILSIGLQLMSGTILGAAAVGIAAVSLILLSKALKEFAKMSWKELGTGLAIVAAALAVLGIAALAMQATGATTALILLGVALIALGAGFALIGLGAGLLAEAFQIIAASGTAAIDVLMYFIDELIMRVPKMLEQFVEGLLLGADVLLKHIPALIGKLSDIVVALIDMLIALTPKFAELATGYILALLGVIQKAVPELVKTGLGIITALLTGIRDNIQEFVGIGVEIIANFIRGIADNITDIVDAGVDLLVSFLEGIAENIDDIGEAVGDIIEAFIDAVVDLYGDIAQAGTDAIVEFLEGMGDNASELARAAGTFVTDFMDAIADEFVAVVDRAAQIVIDFLNDLADVIRENDDKLGDAFGNLGAAIMEGIIVGLTSMGSTFVDACIDIAKDALEAMAKPWEWFSPSHTMVRLGNDIVEGLIIGLDENSRNLNKTVNSISENAVSSFQKAIDDVQLVMQESSEFNPTITPVLDLTQVQNQAGGLNDILAANPLSANASLIAANALSAETLLARDESTPETEPQTPRLVQFEQNNYSPEALNAAKIYRQTRSLIVLTKEELNIA